MKKEWVLTQDAFDNLLTWLGPNREQAGNMYEAIRQRLIRIFTCRGCMEADSLADETINRVARKLQEIEEPYVGDPALYFYGVARRVHLEYLRRKPAPTPLVPVQQTEEMEQEYNCLERCLQNLAQTDRDLVLEYYQDEKLAKKDLRKRLAERLGIAINALRIRAHRIRMALHQCVQRCLEQDQGRAQ